MARFARDDAHADAHDDDAYDDEHVDEDEVEHEHEKDNKQQLDDERMMFMILTPTFLNRIWRRHCRFGCCCPGRILR